MQICEKYKHNPSIQFAANLLGSEGYKALIPVLGEMHEPPRKSVGLFRRLFKWWVPEFEIKSPAGKTNCSAGATP